jgi:hypothetical protein
LLIGVSGRFPAKAILGMINEMDSKKVVTTYKYLLLIALLLHDVKKAWLILIVTFIISFNNT